MALKMDSIIAKILKKTQQNQYNFIKNFYWKVNPNMNQIDTQIVLFEYPIPHVPKKCSMCNFLTLRNVTNGSSVDQNIKSSPIGQNPSILNENLVMKTSSNVKWVVFNPNRAGLLDVTWERGGAESARTF